MFHVPTALEAPYPGADLSCCITGDSTLFLSWSVLHAHLGLTSYASLINAQNLLHVKAKGRVSL